MADAALYLRQSHDPTGREAAVNRQRQDCVSLADSRGWSIVAEFVDNDTSASARRRVGYEAMMTAAALGAFDVILVWHMDRLVRRLADLEPVLRTCQAQGIQIATVTGELDPSTDVGRLVARILSSVAQAEVDRKGARERRAWQQRAEAGHVKTVRRPFGYELDGHVVRREANAVRRAAAAALVGTSLAQICRDLDTRRIPTSTGRSWCPTSLKRMLLNPRYAGFATYHGKVVAVASWTPILSVDTHHELVRVLNDPARRLRHDAARKHLLSGILRCGRCGDTMRTVLAGRPGQRWLAYRCQRSHMYRLQAPVDAVVTNAILNRLTHLDIYALTDIAPVGLDEASAKTRQAMLGIRGQQNQLASLFAEGHINASQLQRASISLRRQFARLESVYAAQAGPVVIAAFLGERGPSPRRSTLERKWSALTLKQRREIIRTMAKITLSPIGPGHHFSPDQVEIKWRRLLPSRAAIT